MPPPPSTIPSHTVQVNPVEREELKAARRKENEHNRKLKEQRKLFIAENERKKQNGEEVEYNGWDDYKQAEIDYDDYDDDDDDMPNMIPVKQTSPEEVPRPIKRSRTGSIGSSSTEPSQSGSSDWIIPQVTNTLPQSQEEVDLYFAQADSGNTSAQSTLNRCIVEYNRLQKEGNRTPIAIEYVMSVFNRMVSVPLWRRNDARQRQQRQGKSSRGPKRTQQRINADDPRTGEAR